MVQEPLADRIDCLGPKLDQSLVGGPDCRLSPVVHPQFIEDVSHVAFYGVMADDEYLCNLEIGEALCQKAKHLQFFAGKAHPDTIIFAYHATLSSCLPYESTVFSRSAIRFFCLSRFNFLRVVFTSISTVDISSPFSSYTG